MWQTDWADKPLQHSPVMHQAPTLDASAVASVYLLSWCEHCIECAVPDCFKLCQLYVQRLDRKCARFDGGISPNPAFPGLFPYGAEIKFRRWGKLESTFGFGSVTPKQVRTLDRIDRSLLGCIRPVSAMFRWLSPYYRMNGGYAVLREKLLQLGTHSGRKQEFDEFVVEVWNLGSQPVRLVLECSQQGPKFRTSILLDPGRTVQRIPAAAMNIDLYGSFGMIRAYPENDAEAHVVFSWLDFVKYGAVSESHLPVVLQPASVNSSPPKVKCVIWDLDQTVWDGILGEQDPDKVTVRPTVKHVIKVLDERGILQSVASKNDHDIAWNVLKRMGLSHLFLYPQINWRPKSENIKQIVNSLNIGSDTCVFIDDSAFERAEVGHEVPGIRTLSDSDVTSLLERPEFDVPVTKESRLRRTSYLAESERKKQSIEYGNRYEAFLESCKMEAVLFQPSEEEHFERCLELLHRSNQLNLSTYRYSREELEALRTNPNVVCICTRCRDRFGDYGIVGFASVLVQHKGVVLKDYVFSCRVAQKKVENAWFRWLARVAADQGFETITAPYTRTARNGILRSTLLECGFSEHDADDQGSVLEISTRAVPPSSEIVSIDAPALDLAGLLSNSSLTSQLAGKQRTAS